MARLRRILITIVAVAGISSIANAANIIVGYYQDIIGPASTDLTDFEDSVLPGFDPGSTNTMVSNVGGNGYITGLSMNSLNTSLAEYTLVSFNIAVRETLTGSYTITNNSTNSAATGGAHVDSYTAVSLGSPLAPALTSGADPANDLL